MINELRTLLANLPPAQSPGGEGEEPIATAFAPIPLPDPLARLRATLFGSDPDRRTVMHRVGAMLELIRRCPLADHETWRDDRLSYRPGPSGAPFRYGLDFGIAARHLPGFRLTYIDLPDDAALGRSHWSWHITDWGNDAATVAYRDRTFDVEADGGLFEVSLPDSTIVAYWTAADAATGGVVEYRSRPQSLARRLIACEAQRSADITWLLSDDAEPMLSYRRLFRSLDPSPERWGALLLAIAERTRQAHVAANSPWLEG